MPETDRRFDAHQALAQWLALAGVVPTELFPLPAPAHSMLGDVRASHGRLISAAIEDIADVVAALAPEWSTVGCGWLVAKGADERIEAALQELHDAAGTVEVAAAAKALAVPEGHLADYLASVGGRFIYRGRVLCRDKLIGDRALAVLTLADGAMTTAQLAELIPGRTRPSIRNALAAEPRIIRSAPDIWSVEGREGAAPVNHARPETTGHGPWAVTYSALALGDPPRDPSEALSRVAVALGLRADAPYCTIAARLRLRDRGFVADTLADAVARGYTLEP